jgi:hypothetical protein
MRQLAEVLRREDVADEVGDAMLTDALRGLDSNELMLF